MKKLHLFLIDMFECEENGINKRESLNHLFSAN